MQDMHGNTPLTVAAAQGKLEALQALLAAGADPNVRRPKDRLTPLHLCANNGDVECLEVLLAGGAKVEARDADGDRPLHHLVYGWVKESSTTGQEKAQQYVAAGKALLAGKADPLAGNNAGTSALVLAEQAGATHLAQRTQR